MDNGAAFTHSDLSDTAPNRRVFLRTVIEDSSFMSTLAVTSWASWAGSPVLFLLLKAS